MQCILMCQIPYTHHALGRRSLLTTYCSLLTTKQTLALALTLILRPEVRVAQLGGDGLARLLVGGEELTPEGDRVPMHLLRVRGRLRGSRLGLG